jgi:hypothetical protein
VEDVTYKSFLTVNKRRYSPFKIFITPNVNGSVSQVWDVRVPHSKALNVEVQLLKQGNTIETQVESVGIKRYSVKCIKTGIRGFFHRIFHHF